MNRTEYLDRLRKSLSYLEESKIEEIIYDYYEHFEVGMNNGKTEEEIAERLGAPEDVAGQYTFENRYAQSNPEKRTEDRNFVKAFFVGLGLVVLNLSVLLSIYLGWWSLMFAGFLGTLSMILGGTVFLLEPLFSLNVLVVPGVLLPLSMKFFFVFLGLFFITASLLGMILLFKAVQWTITWTKKYIMFNINIVKKVAMS